jgi:nitrite reductase (NADH) small subunit
MIEPSTTAEGQAGNWIVVIESGALQEKQAIEVLVGTEVLALFRQNGELYAIDGICAHQGGPIAKGSLDHKCITCPWHGWQYDISTGENLLTKRKMLRTFPVREVNGLIEVQVDVG